jgi:hypothetical protein
MPVRIKYLDNGLGAEFIGTGIVNGKDLIEATKNVFASAENLKESRYGLLDFSGVDFFNLSSAELRIVTQLDKDAAAINPDLVIAIVTGKNRTSGVSRIWHAYMDETNWDTGIFGSRPDAESWIKKRVKEKFGVDITLT